MSLPGLSGITGALDWYQRNLGGQRVTGEIIRNPLLQRAFFRGISPGRLLSPGDAALQAGAAAPDAATATEVAFRDAPWQRFGTEVATDPMNLVGVGIPGRLAQVGALKAVRPELEALDALGAWRNAKLNAGFSAAGKATRSTLEPAAQVLIKGGERFGEAHPKIAQGVELGSRMWREQALHPAPAYYVRNWGENVMRAITNGEFDVATETVKGTMRRPTRAQEIYRELGIDGPHQIDGLIQDPTLHNNARVLTSGESVELGRGGRSAYRELGDKISNPGIRGALHKFGGLMEKGTAFNAERIEGPAREAAFAHAYDEARAAGATTGQALEQGVGHANELFYDYSKNTPLDQVARHGLAFHKFALNNLPAQMKLATQRPAILNVPNQYYDVSEDYADQRGLSQRFNGSMPIGGEAQDGTQAHISPFDMWSVGQLVKMARRNDPESGATGLGDVANTMRDMGLGLHPFINVPLAATGQFGREIPNGLLRLAQPTNALAGLLMHRPVDVEGPYKNLVEPNGLPYQEWLIRKRQAELGLKQGIRPERALQDPALRQQAEADSAVESSIPSLGGWLGVPGLKVLNAEEAMIRQNEAIAGQAFDHGLKNQGYANPTSGAYALNDPLAAKVKLGLPLEPREVAMILSGQAGPVLQAQYLKQQTKALRATNGGR